MQDKIDVEANISMGGPTGQAGAIRWGISWGLRSFVDKNMIEKMKVGKSEPKTRFSKILKNFKKYI